MDRSEIDSLHRMNKNIIRTDVENFLLREMVMEDHFDLLSNNIDEDYVFDDSDKEENIFESDNFLGDDM